MNRTALIRRTAPLSLSIALICAWLCAAAASEQTPPPKPDATSEASAAKSTADGAKPADNVRFYLLQHADPNFVIQALKTDVAGGPMKVVVDPRTSALIVWAPQDMQKKVAELVKNIDMLPEADEQIKLFTLANVDPESAAKVLRAMVPKMRVATEQQTRSVLAAGSMENLNVAKALLTKLDETGQTAIPGAASNEVRVVWLASGLTGEGAGAPPADDLKDVVAELSRQGVKDLRQVGEIAVQTMTGRNGMGGNFQVMGSPRFGNQTAEFSASGLLSKLPNGSLVMNVRIATRKESSFPGQKLNEIDSQIVLPEKQYVVLAAAPTGPLTSVFVVQVVRIAKPDQKKDGKPR
jgi:hypothetical protein